VEFGTDEVLVGGEAGHTHESGYPGIWIVWKLGQDVSQFRCIEPEFGFFFSDVDL